MNFLKKFDESIDKWSEIVCGPKHLLRLMENKKMSISDFSWIKVKQFKFDPDKSWEENYKELEKHHIEETSFLINKIRELDKQADK